MQTSVSREKHSLYSSWTYLIGRVFYGKSYKERLLFLAESALSALLAAVFYSAKLPYTTLAVGAPLFDAFLCSVGKAAIGAFAGCFWVLYNSGASLPIYIAYGLTFVLRIALSRSYASMDRRRPPFTEGIVSKLAACAILCFTLSGLHIAEQGIDQTTVSTLLATLSCAPALTIVLSVFFDGCPPARIGSAGADLHRIFYELCVYSVFGLIVYIFGDVYYMGVSLGSVFAVFFTIVTAKRGGFLRGTVTGAIVGIVTSPAYAAPMALMGFVSALLFPLGALPACSISAVAAVALASYLNGMDAFITFLPETVIAVAVTSPVIRYSFLPERFPFPRDNASDPLDTLTAATEEGLRKAEEFRAIKELSEGLKEISDEIGVYDQSEAEVRDVCSKIHSELCENCALCPICWEHERASTENDLVSLAARYRRNKSESANNVSAYLSDHCIKYKELTAALKQYCGMTEKKAKTADTASFRNEYGMISSILQNFTEQNKSELTRHFETEEVLSRRLRAMGFTAFEVTVYGDKRTRISFFGPDLSSSPELAEKMRAMFSEVCGKPFMAPLFENTEYPCAVFSEAERFHPQVAVSTICKEGESVSGDTATSFYDDNGKFYALISDGMGSGKTANECSKLTASLLAKLLRLNIDHSMVIGMLGDIIKARFRECFSTVDLMELDMVRGSAKFLKSGAAASYIIRQGSVYCVNAQSMPVGITKEASPTELFFNLSAGDIVLMVSDGVAEDKSDGKWIAELLGMLEHSSPKSLADAVMDKAIKEKGKISDDMTVLAVKIEDAQAQSEEKVG